LFLKKKEKVHDKILMGTMHAKVQALLNQASIPSLVKVERIGHEWWATHFEK
jgi:hypothetical protein